MIKSLIVTIALAGLVFCGQMQSAEAAPSAPALSQPSAQSSILQEADWACGPRRCAWVPGYRGTVPSYALRWGPPTRPNCYWKRGLLGNWKYKCDDDWD